MEAPTTTICVDLTPEGEITQIGEALLEALDNRGFKYSQVSRKDNQITYRVWDPSRPPPGVTPPRT